MNQKQTLELWARCEAARAEAKAAGKSEDDAHAATTAVWNAWAQPLLDQRKAMEAAGTWKAEKDWRGTLEGGNPDTTAWLDQARAVFSTDGSKHTFDTDVTCTGWAFTGAAVFDGATFTGGAWFGGATFTGAAVFEGATFTGDAVFEGATFTGAAGFGGATFEGAARFEGATFTGDARFALTRFKGYGTFESARFERAASFMAVQGETGFSLAGTRFSEVPDFIQANFFQSPRLDNVHVAPRLVSPGRKAITWPTRFLSGLVKRHFDGNRDIPARYRALKRLAIQGHDHEREQMFHAGDITSSRFTTDWPWPYIRRPEWWAVRHEGPVARDDKGKVTRTETKPWRVWADWGLRRLWLPVGLAVGPFTADGLSSFFRFWFGLAYGLISNFGRSVIRPLVAWLVVLVASAAIYLGAHPEMEGRRKPHLADESTLTLAHAYAVSSYEAWAGHLPCVADNGDIRGLPEPVRAATDAPTEALFMALAAGLVLGDIGAPDASTRTYGCLYGLTASDPGNAAKRSAVPYPAYIAGWIVIQKLLSAILLFLFGLAVRNMLKLK